MTEIMQNILYIIVNDFLFGNITDKVIFLRRTVNYSDLCTIFAELLGNTFADTVCAVALQRDALD